ncbi:MAG: Mur ligase family protein, partial [Spirochaetes bacterium]|nr:Mur ligase family protein [Spirochaetota bacterium]
GRFESAGVAGVHGKTTVTALCGAIMKAAQLPAQILVGSAVADFGGGCTLSLGNKYFVAETCEYRKHFLSFQPKNIILTAVESDHQDFFPDYASIREAFLEYCRLLPTGGGLIYCADDAGASDVAKAAAKESPGIRLVPYGFSADGDYRVTFYQAGEGRGVFGIAGFPGDFNIEVPGRHQALNVAGALALTSAFLEKEIASGEGGIWPGEKIQAVKKAVENFRGSKRRSEVIGKAAGIVFMDDYGHHPSAIKTTLAGIKSFYPGRRLVASFMSHTYTRTAALFDDFAGSFGDADIVFLHKIYASAREKYSGGVSGKTLYEKVLGVKAGGEVFYAEEPLDAFEALAKMLKPGDVFVTLGAGNNWPLGEKLFFHFRETEQGRGA